MRRAEPDSHIFAAQYPHKAGWTGQALLLGQAVDALRWLQWAQTKDGHKNRNRPKTVLPVEGRHRRRQGQERPGAAPAPTPLSKLRQMLPGRDLSDQDRARRVSRLFG